MNYFSCFHETHDGKRLRTAAIGDDLTEAGGDVVTTRAGAIGIFLFVPNFVVVGQQRFALVGALFIVKSLRIGKRDREVQDVHRSGHIFMNEAHQLEVASGRKGYGERLSGDYRRSSDARRPVEGCRRATHKTGAADGKRQAGLAVTEEGDGMNLVYVGRPGNTLAGVNPKFIGQKSQRLMPQILTLRSDDGPPLRARRLRKN